MSAPFVMDPGASHAHSELHLTSEMSNSTLTLLASIPNLQTLCNLVISLTTSVPSDIPLSLGYAVSRGCDVHRLRAPLDGVNQG